MTQQPAAVNIAALGDAGEPLWGLGGLWIIKVSAASTGGSFSLIEVRMTRSTGTPLHRHDADEETFIVLDGSLALLASGKRVDAGPGDIVYVAPGEPHAWRAETDLTRFLIIATPRHEAFYRACCTPANSLSQPPDAGAIDLSVIIPAGHAHGVEILSPPPDY
jgi:quercetin dioxygenase-like cupin family protein